MKSIYRMEVYGISPTKRSVVKAEEEVLLQSSPSQKGLRGNKLPTSNVVGNKSPTKQSSYTTSNILCAEFPKTTTIVRHKKTVVTRPRLKTRVKQKDNDNMLQSSIIITKK